MYIGYIYIYVIEIKSFLNNAYSCRYVISQPNAVNVYVVMKKM